MPNTASPVAEESANHALATIAVSRIKESETNPRRTFDEGKQGELTESVRRHGVLQPLLLRPNGGDWEVVCGHRRLRAAIAAGRPEVPAVVRELSDKEALEIQFVENLQREDLNPMEEADGYSRLVNQHGYRVEDLALKLDKSEAYVYSRLKLVDLPEKAAESLAAGELSLSAAFLVARIPDAKLREEAAGAVVRGWGRPMSAREARTWIHRNCMLLLKDAPFPTDEELGGAGPCSTCPKRTVNVPALFADFKKDDLCTDPKCFGKKRDAIWNRLKAEAKEAGKPVLEKKAASKVFSKWGGLTHDSGYVMPDDTPWEVEESYLELLGADSPEPIVARNPHTGEIVTLLDRKAVLETLKAKGFDWAGESEDHDARSKESLRKEKERRDLEAKVRAAVVSEMVKAGEADDLPEQAWRALTLGAIQRAWHDSLKDIASRRGLKKTEKDWRPETALAAIAVEAPLPEVRGLLLEVVVGPFLRSAYPHGLTEKIEAAVAGAFGIKVRSLRTRVRREEKAKAEAKAKKAKKTPKRSRGSRQTKAGKES